MRTFKYSARFKRDYKLCKKRGRDMRKMRKVLSILASGEIIPERYKDHPLKSNWKGYRDIHIEPDWILIYKLEGNTIVLLAATGTHSDILEK